MIATAPGQSGEAVVHVFPTAGQPMSGIPPRPCYPWSDVSGQRVPVGGHLVLQDLPATRVQVHVAHPRDTATEFAWIEPGGTAQLDLRLTPAPTRVVRVVRDGKPVGGVQVTLQHANPLSATLAVLGEAGIDTERVLRAQPIVLLDEALQPAETDSDGRASFGVSQRVKDAPWITVAVPEEGFMITRRLDGGTAEGGSRAGGRRVAPVARPGGESVPSLRRRCASPAGQRAASPWRVRAADRRPTWTNAQHQLRSAAPC